MARVESISNSKDIKITTSVSKPNNEVVFFEYKNNNDTPNKNENTINPIAQNLVTLNDGKGFFTRNLSDIEDVVNNQIDETNIAEIMTDYNDKKGKSLIADICSYKCAGNNTRKSIILNLINKLEKANLSDNTEVSLLASSLRKEVEYQFDKWGFIDTTYITSMFKALVFKTQCVPANTDYESLEDIKKEFSIEGFNTNYKKEEGIGKIRIQDEKGNPQEIFIDKVVTFTFDNGEKLVENYSYNRKNKEFVLYEKVIYNNDQKVKSVNYFSDGNISQVHRYLSEDDTDSYYYRNDGTLYQHFIYTKEKAQHLTFGKNGNLASCVNYPRAEGGRFILEESGITNFDRNGCPQASYKNMCWYSDGVGGKSHCDEEFLNRIWLVSKDNLDVNLVSSFHKEFMISSYGKRYTIKLLSHIKTICDELANERDIDIKDLSKQFNNLIDENEKKSIMQAQSVLAQVIARVTNGFDYVDTKEFVNITPVNGKIDNDFSQGNFGTCWLTSSIKSLTMTSAGQKILKETVRQDPNTNEIIVTLKGAPEGKQVYRYTPEEINQAAELSNGDGDERAIEMAVRDLFLLKDGDKYKGGYDLNANTPTAGLELLTGKKLVPRFENFGSAENRTSDEKSMLNDYLDSIANKGNVIGICTFNDNFSWNSIYTSHAYTFCRVDDDYVYVINPWNTSKEIYIKREDFLKYCETLHSLD